MSLPVNEVKNGSRFLARRQPFAVESPITDNSWWLSESGDVVVLRSAFGQVVAFPKSKPTSMHVLEKYLAHSEIVVERLRRLMGVSIHTPCVWSSLTDDEFEQLCYDAVRRMARFDPSSVRKMGHSRSRDGGRDILAITKTRAGSDPQRWVVQCKLITSKRSLAAGGLQVSDTIDQYGAGGYLIMTNAIVDATLYDKLEGIGRNRTIECEAWSGLELERFLQGHNDLLCRYFPKDKTTNLATCTPG